MNYLNKLLMSFAVVGMLSCAPLKNHFQGYECIYSDSKVKILKFEDRFYKVPINKSPQLLGTGNYVKFGENMVKILVYNQNGNSDQFIFGEK